MNVVWFKRDLRIRDHLPLHEASRRGPCICLYVYEPEIIESDEFDASHLDFINQALKDLSSQLGGLGGKLIYRVGRMPNVLDELHRTHGVEALFSHEETGNRITYDRDLRVARWAQENRIPWTEYPQNGVIRRLRSRDGWSKSRDRFLKTALIDPPNRIDVPDDIATGSIQQVDDLCSANVKLEPTRKTDCQRGGQAVGRDVLDQFLYRRSETYSSDLSSPVTAPTSCSRLSPYLAWGCLSMKEIVTELRDRQAHLREMKKSGEAVGDWLKSLRAFESRLSWHCHFMQKLEDQPSIEFENMSRAYDGLREDEFDQNHFDAWCTGQTGYPMVDACMRALLQHSWINFRMRAMLVSFASYHLWLHWRPTSVFLAKHFLDFEPGIHFSQFQMQSGTTGINTVRIYSPIKQVKDHDPQGAFIRKYVPELSAVPDEHLAEPHKMSQSEQSKSSCRIGKDYPEPIVEHTTAYRTARDRIYAVRKTAAAKQESQRVVKKHGSRKRTTAR